jgi:hypothetical protein
VRKHHYVDAGGLPPRRLIAGSVNGTMVGAAERDPELIADPAAQGLGLHVSEVMGVGRLPPQRRHLGLPVPPAFTITTEFCTPLPEACQGFGEPEPARGLPWSRLNPPYSAKTLLFSRMTLNISVCNTGKYRYFITSLL